MSGNKKVALIRLYSHISCRPFSSYCLNFSLYDSTSLICFIGEDNKDSELINIYEDYYINSRTNNETYLTNEIKVTNPYPAYGGRDEETAAILACELWPEHSAEEMADVMADAIRDSAAGISF